MRYVVVLLLLLNIGYFGWSLVVPSQPQSSGEPRPLRNSGLRLVSEARTAEHVCLFISGFADIFKASEFAAANVGGALQATVYVAQEGAAAEVRLERMVEDPDDLPQWPDFAGQSPELVATENTCEMFAPAEHLH